MDFVDLLEEQDSNLWTLLTHAGDHEHYDPCMMLVGKGANINAKYGSRFGEESCQDSGREELDFHVES